MIDRGSVCLDIKLWNCLFLIVQISSSLLYCLGIVVMNHHVVIVIDLKREVAYESNNSISCSFGSRMNRMSEEIARFATE